MKTHTRGPRRKRIGSPRLLPAFDLLGPRIVLSAAGVGLSTVAISPGPLEVASVDPAPGATLARSPAEWSVTFDRPIDPSSVLFDFRIDRVGPDGSSTPIDGLGNYAIESVDPSGRGIDVATAEPLAPGHYRLVLLGDATVTGLDGEPAATGADSTVSDLTIGSTGVRLGDAVDLGVPGSTPIATSGSLDLASNAGDVRLYRVELAAGHFWRLGVEVDAQRIGSPLDSTVAVFDAQGLPIKTSQVGLPATPSDPYLYLGLNPGVYYIGVSGLGNVPGHAGGYDPVAGTAGMSGLAGASGPFRLLVAADAADAATQVTTFVVNYADPTVNIPTGLTLQFSGPVDPRAMDGHGSDLITLVDATGREWQADSAGYDATRASLTFLFDRPLPPGFYTVKLAGQRDLVDLAGKAPVAAGLPAGTLGTLVVAPATPKGAPQDLGPIFPAAALNPTPLFAAPGPGKQVSYRMVLTEAGQYDIETSYTGDPAEVSATFAGSTVTFGPGPQGGFVHHVQSLPAGVVTFVVTGGKAGSTVQLLVQLLDSSRDSLMNNGIGQSGALGLRLITPGSISAGIVPPGTSSDVGPEPTAPPVLYGPAPASNGGAVEASAASPASSGTPSISAGLFIAPTAATVGHPSTDGEAISAVGPVAPGGQTALASSVAGIPAGIGLGGRPGPLARTSIERTELSDGPERSEATLAVLADPEDALPPLPAATADGSPAHPRGPGLLDRAAGLLAGWLPGTRPAAGEVDPARRDDVALAAIVAIAPATPEPDEVKEQAESADLSGSIGVAVIAIGVARAQRDLGRWIGRFKTRRVLARRLSRNV